MTISDATRRYVLGVLVVVYTFNFIDRQILSILLEPIKLELGLSDTQTGLAHRVCIRGVLRDARHADRAHRRPQQPAQPDRNRAGGVERHDGAVRVCHELLAPADRADRRRRGRSRLLAGIALDHLRLLPRTIARHRARHLFARHSVRNSVRLLRRRNDQRNVRVARGVLHRRYSGAAARVAGAVHGTRTAARHVGRTHRARRINRASSKR